MNVRLTVISVAVVLAIAAAVLSRGIASNPNASYAQPSGDEPNLRELAERLLAPAGGSSGGGPTFTAKLLPGELPTGLNVDLPMPSGSRLVGSVARRSGPMLLGADVVLDVPGQVSDAHAFYRDELAALGFGRWPVRWLFAGPLVGPPFGPVGPDVVVPMNPALSEPQMAECLANAPDPRLFSPPAR